MDIVGKKKLYFLISILVMIPGLISLGLYGLRLGIDFTGGSLMEYQITADKGVQNQTLAESIRKQGVDVSTVQQASNNTFIIRSKPIDSKKHDEVTESLQKQYKTVKDVGFTTVGPTVGYETSQNALKALIIASLLIVLYIAWSFRTVPRPASSWRFGICAIIALLHDVLVVVGVFSLLGHFYHVEVDSLFVTALLTVIGFSVHDTIVVFDRIRENLIRLPGMPFGQVVNASIMQTFTRSLNTSLTTMLVLVTMLLFGGESIRWFVVALLVGIASGTYSSIFNAAPLLVVWHEWRNKKKNEKVLR